MPSELFQHDDTPNDVESWGSAKALSGSSDNVAKVRKQLRNLDLFMIIFGLITDATKTDKTDQKFSGKDLGAGVSAPGYSFGTRQLLRKMRNILQCLSPQC